MPCYAFISHVPNVHKLNKMVTPSKLIMATSFSKFVVSSTFTFMCSNGDTYPAFMSRLQKLMEYSLIADQWEA